MADDSYMNRGRIINGKGGLAGIRYNTNSVVEEGWSRPGYVTKTDVCEDHLCRPVFVDADGKARPAVVVLPSYQKSEGFVSKIETVVEERVYKFPATNRTHGSAAKVEPVKDHAGDDRLQGKPRNHSPDRSPTINGSITSEHPGVGLSGTGLPGGMFQRWKPESSDYGGHNNSVTSGWGKPSGGPNDIRTSGWSRNNGGTNDTRTDGWNRPTGGTYDPVNNGLSRPNRGTNDTRTDGWNRPIGGTYDTVNNGLSRPNSGTYDTRWSKPSEIGNEGWHKPVGGTNDIQTNGWGKSTGTGGWNKPIAGTNDIHTNGWSKSSGTTMHQPIHEAPISRPTHDAGAAVDFVKESTRPHSVRTAAQPGRFPSSIPTSPVKESVIDSREAARKYGGISAAKEEPVTGPAIDSKKAAEKYHGTFV